MQNLVVQPVQFEDLTDGGLNLQNLKNEIHDLSLGDKTKTNFNTKIDGSTGTKIDNIVRRNGAKVNFGKKLGMDDKETILVKAGVGTAKKMWDERKDLGKDKKETKSLVGGLVKTGAEAVKVLFGRKLVILI